MNTNAWTRRVDRWVSFSFTLMATTFFVTMASGDNPQPPDKRKLLRA